MNKHLHRLLIILIFISAASAAYLFSNPKNNAVSPPLEPPTTTTLSSTPEELIPAHLENNPDNTSQDRNKKTENKIPIPVTRPTTTPPTSSPPTENQANILPVTFIIDNREYQLTVAPEATTYDGMLQLKEKNQISFISRKFSGLGYFIEEINGIKNNPSAGFYWTLYINNEEAKVGASNYTLKSNDIITWKYENK